MHEDALSLTVESNANAGVCPLALSLACLDGQHEMVKSIDD